VSPPFEPAIRDGAIYARGASDDKGMLFATIAAVEALKATDSLPALNIIFCFEGAEESFATGLADLVRAERDRFACDLVVSADSVMVDRHRLSLTVSTKGVCALAIHVQTAATDLHSGLYGATIPNAAQVLARLVATLHDAEGRVAIAGFYDDVRELTLEERADLATTPFDPNAFLSDLGATAFWGEPGYTPLERLGTRPTIDVVGISGGPSGDHIHAITPAQATAKLSCRLVPNQDPERIVTLIERHLNRHCPPGATVTTRSLPGIAPFAIRRDHPGLKVAQDILRELSGQEPLVRRSGGALPIAAVFQRDLGADMIFFAWSMPDANIHAPNERLRLEDFWVCARAYCRYLTGLAGALA
jgi:acetylornithine deacetylase/succinyl-diaminopimelate desuccinylase-like protein